MVQRIDECALNILIQFGTTQGKEIWQIIREEVLTKIEQTSIKSKIDVGSIIGEQLINLISLKD